MSFDRCRELNLKMYYSTKNFVSIALFNTIKNINMTIYIKQVFKGLMILFPEFIR